MNYGILLLLAIANALFTVVVYACGIAYLLFVSIVNWMVSIVVNLWKSL